MLVSITSRGDVTVVVADRFLEIDSWSLFFPLDSVFVPVSGVCTFVVFGLSSFLFPAG